MGKNKGANMNLPNEYTTKIKDIINSDLSLHEKAEKIYQYDDFLCSMADRRAPKPSMTIAQIEIELKSRELLKNPETNREITQEDIDEILGRR